MVLRGSKSRLPRFPEFAEDCSAYGQQAGFAAHSSCDARPYAAQPHVGYQHYSATQCDAPHRSKRADAAALVRALEASEPPREEASEPYGNDESVEQCLVVMREVLSEQVARARHLDTKAGTAAGFSATALALNLALGSTLLKRDLGSVGGTAIHISFGVAVLFLGAAALTAIYAGLKPMGFDDLHEEAIDSYGARPKVITPPAELRLTWLQNLTKMALSARKTGDSKATWGTVVAILLIAGVLGVAGQAATLVVAS